MAAVVPVQPRLEWGAAVGCVLWLWLVQSSVCRWSGSQAKGGEGQGLDIKARSEGQIRKDLFWFI